MRELTGRRGTVKAIRLPAIHLKGTDTHQVSRATRGIRTRGNRRDIRATEATTIPAIPRARATGLTDEILTEGTNRGLLSTGREAAEKQARALMPALATQSTPFGKGFNFLASFCFFLLLFASSCSEPLAKLGVEPLLSHESL